MILNTLTPSSITGPYAPTASEIFRLARIDAQVRLAIEEAGVDRLQMVSTTATSIPPPPSVTLPGPVAKREHSQDIGALLQPVPDAVAPEVEKDSSEGESGSVVGEEGNVPRRGFKLRPPPPLVVVKPCTLCRMGVPTNLECRLEHVNTQ